MNKETDPLRNHCDKSIRNWLLPYQFIVPAKRYRKWMPSRRVGEKQFASRWQMKRKQKANTNKSWYRRLLCCDFRFARRISAWQDNAAGRRHNRIINWVFVFAKRFELDSVGFLFISPVAFDTCNFLLWILICILEIYYQTFLCTVHSRSISVKSQPYFETPIDLPSITSDFECVIIAVLVMKSNKKKTFPSTQSNCFRIYLIIFRYF